MYNSLRNLASKRRFGLFMSVGAVGWFVETTLFLALNVGFEAAPLTAKLVSAEASITVMFFLNDRVTFNSVGSDDLFDVLARWFRSNAVRSFGIGIALTVLWALTSRTDVRFVVSGVDLWPTIANTVAIGVGSLVNYVFESIITWNVGQY